jgi:hypothetical protein
VQGSVRENQFLTAARGTGIAATVGALGGDVTEGYPVAHDGGTVSYKVNQRRRRDAGQHSFRVGGLSHDF